MSQTIHPLSASERTAALVQLPDWQHQAERDAITRTFVFADFVAAFAFTSATAQYAESAQHHPEWFNVYSRVEVLLTTHDAGGLSERDIAMAQWLDVQFGQYALTHPQIQE